ncbi:hypothetical protein [uncultured Pseudomonas sp.]|uniref:hypothetical protein n=1 Tax=uncultured Pseudomonas sp. TaxID=114707 RepID=UPI0025CDB620|nr:hypothetical protein [uncultured Pseudomonas sp.]
MTINTLTIDELARLFAARKDTLDSHVLWITRAGEVRLDPMTPHTEEQAFRDAQPQLCAALPMYRRGLGYVGKKAAADRDFIEEQLGCLRHAWHQARPSARVA